MSCAVRGCSGERQSSRCATCGTQTISAAPHALSQLSCNQFVHPWVLAHTDHVLYSTQHGAILSTHCNCLRLQHAFFFVNIGPHITAEQTRTDTRRVRRRTAVTSRQSTLFILLFSKLEVPKLGLRCGGRGSGHQPLSQSSRTPCSRSTAPRLSPWRWTWQCPAAASHHPRTAPNITR